MASYLLIFTISQQFVYAQIVQPQNQTMCNCVIFRLDDVQDYWIHSAQVQVMDLFISKDQSLSVGIIMNHTGSDQVVLQKIKQGQNLKLFELDIHGWNHVDYTTLTQQEQKTTLELANNKMQALFGVKSNVFIPPYDLFNNSTLSAMSSSGIGILSASSDPPNNSRFIFSPTISSEPYSIYQLPETAGFMFENKSGVWQKESNSAILDNVDQGIAKRGYTVVVLHPQNFVKMENGLFVDIVDPIQMNNLSKLIDLILAKNIRITTFENTITSSPLLDKVQPTISLVSERNNVLEQEKLKIRNANHACHLDIKNSHNHKQAAHDCKVEMKKLREEFKSLQTTVKLEFKNNELAKLKKV